MVCDYAKQKNDSKKVQRIEIFHTTSHAIQRVQERGLALDSMKQAVIYHDSRTQQYRGDHGGYVYKFKKTVDGNTLAVIAEVKENECWLMSGFYEKH
jgi:hypothetical protein